MATFAAARMATADPHGDQRPVLSADVADATSVDVELASGARAVAARRPSRRRLYVGCGVASAFAAVIAVVAVYHAMEASKISGTTGDVIAVSVQDNVSSVSQPRPTSACVCALLTSTRVPTWHSVAPPYQRPQPLAAARPAPQQSSASSTATRP